MPHLGRSCSISTAGNEVGGEDCNLHPCDDTLKTWRDIPPAHYVLKIDSLQSLVQFLEKNEREYYESNEFKVSDLIWQLLLYPKGDESRNGGGHISLYLKFINPWRKINALLNFFIYDQDKKKYLSIQDKTVRQFDGPKKEYLGHPRLVCLDRYRNASNGFLANESCIFGVEVYVLEDEAEGERFHTPRKNFPKCYIWNVKKLSGLKEVHHFSELFSVGNYKWKLHLCSKRHPKVKGKYLSVFLCQQLDKDSSESNLKMNVEFELSVNDRVNKNNSNNIARRGNAWFSADNPAWGFPDFINLAESERLKSLIVEGKMQIEVQIISISMAKSFSADTKEDDTGCGKEAGTERKKDASQEDEGHRSIAQSCGMPSQLVCCECECGKCNKF